MLEFHYRKELVLNFFDFYDFWLQAEDNLIKVGDHRLRGISSGAGSEIHEIEK